MPHDDPATFARQSTDPNALRRRLRFGDPQDRIAVARHARRPYLTREVVAEAIGHAPCLAPLAIRDDLPGWAADEVARAAVGALGWTGSVRAGSQALRNLVQNGHELPLPVLAEVVRLAGRHAVRPGGTGTGMDRHTGTKQQAEHATSVLEARTLVEQGAEAVTTGREDRYRRLRPIRAGHIAGRQVLVWQTVSSPEEKRLFFRHMLAADPSWAVAVLEEAGERLQSTITAEDLMPALSSDHQSVRTRALLLAERVGRSEPAGERPAAPAHRTGSPRR